MLNYLKLNQWSALCTVTFLCCFGTSCQTPSNQFIETNPFSVYFTGWPKESVDRLLPHFLESKSFLASEKRDGTLCFDKKSSNWDDIKYGSFLEPNAWLRLETVTTEEKDTLQTKLTVKTSIITHRLSSLEETRKPKRHHIQQAKELIQAFEMIMLQPVNMDLESNSTIQDAPGLDER